MRNATLLLGIGVGWLGLAAWAMTAEPAGALNLTLRRLEAAPGGGGWRPVEQRVSWAPPQTAAVICDMWDNHWCKGATKRVAELAPRINQFVAELRRRGVLIIHCPSETMKFYEGTPARRLAQAAPKLELPEPVRACGLDPEREAPLPIDDSDGGCDDQPQCAPGKWPPYPWSRQIATIEIHPGDAVTDNAEAYYLMRQRGITNVLIMGVHENMCVLARPFGIRRLVKLGQNVALVRDLTDTMYNSRRRPFVDHFTGTDLVAWHIEKYWCPTLTSDQILGGQPFRFADDTKPPRRFQDYAHLFASGPAPKALGPSGVSVGSESARRGPAPDQKESGGSVAGRRDYRFDGRISRQVLDNYLSRAVTFTDLLHGKGDVADNLRFLTNIGAKFVGRAIYRWGGEAGLPALLERARSIAAQAHKADPDLILQAACFEIVTPEVERLPVPDWVFREFGLPVEQRHFRYQAMLYPDGHRKDQWSRGGSVPDMSQLETRLWFFYLAASYIDVGVEAIHFGQVEIMDDRDKDHVHWRELLRRVRAYAAQQARRRLVLCDAHVPSGGLVHDGQLLFDFHSFPLRIKEVPDQPQEGLLEVGYMDSIYRRSKGGRSPSGWSCEALPYLVELDNYGVSKRPGQPGTKWFVWGYDEMSWFAHQPEAYRNRWLRYGWQWLRENDPVGWLQMPGSRVLHAPVNGQWWYWAHTPSPATPHGFNQEQTIKAIWAGH